MEPDQLPEQSTAAAVAEARVLLRAASRVVVLTGAGISTDSGIPDFRGPQGVWTKNPAAEKAATLQHYVADPEIRRAAWRSRIDSPMFAAQPNSGHLALLWLQQQEKLLLLITQNVDGLHQIAGIDPAAMVEIHGTAHEVNCLACGERAPMERALARVRAGEEDPPCRTCGGILKSATISFGQQLVHNDLARAERAAQECDLLLAVGSTLQVFPIAEVVPVAKRSGAKIVIVNRDPTAMDHLADVVVNGLIGDVLPAVLQERTS